MAFLKKLISGVLDFFYPMFRKVISFQIFAYLAVGGMNTFLNILIYVILYELMLNKEGVFIGEYNVASYTLALVISFILTIPTGFWLSKNFAFKVNDDFTKKSKNQLLKYFIVVSQGLLSDYFLLKVCIELFNFQPSIAKILSTFIVLTINFLLQKYFTFKIQNLNSQAKKK